jgi:hypothetical protein
MSMKSDRISGAVLEQNLLGDHTKEEIKGGCM